jgi:protein-L-isoaspartate(D-aspartate) O-methyltransferase
LKPGSKVLDVGSGSGYLCAAFYELVKTPEKRTYVVGIEHIDELVEWSISNLRKSFAE